MVFWGYIVLDRSCWYGWNYVYSLHHLMRDNFKLWDPRQHLSPWRPFGMIYAMSDREYVTDMIVVVSVRVSPDASEIQTVSATSVNTASVVSEVLTATQSVQHGSSVPTESVRTAADSSPVNSLSSAVHTSASLQHHQLQQHPAVSDQDQGQCFCFCLCVISVITSVCD